MSDERRPPNMNFVIVFSITIVVAISIIQWVFGLGLLPGMIVAGFAGFYARRLGYIWDDTVWPGIKTSLNQWAKK